MKNIYLLVVSFCFFSIANAQIVDIPNSNFKKELLKADATNTIAKDLNNIYCKIDVNNDKEIQLTEAENISWLNLSNSQISNLVGIENFTQLNYLDLSNQGGAGYNNIRSLNISPLTKLQYFNCQSSGLKTLDFTGCKDLKLLNCSNNYIGSLDLRGFTKLETIESDGANLTLLNVDGLLYLKTLLASGNEFSTLDLTTCKNLEKVVMHSGGLVSIDVSGLTKLENINVYNNKLTSLKLSGCTSLSHLDAWINKMTVLEASDLKSLKHLNVAYNNLQTLNIQNSNSLEYINCDENELKSLDVNEFANLKSLFCSHNNLTYIEVNKLKKLEWLTISFNQIETLDISSCPLLSSLHINNNNLKFVNIKNGIKKLNYQSYDNDNLKYICCDEEEIDYLFPNYPLQYTFALNTYCSFTPGGTFYTLEGNSKLDLNNNGCDLNDENYSNLNFSLTDGDNKGNFITNSTNYSIPVHAGTHTLTPILENPNYFTVAPASITVTFPTQTSPFIQNFCIAPNGVHNDLEITILPTIPARPGFDATYKIIYKNKGNQTQSGSVSLSFNDTVLDFLTAMPAINNQTTDKLTWDFTNLKPLESREITLTFNVNSPMETPAVNNDDRLSFNALINPVAGDEKPVDNSFALRQTVVGSYDPNDKTCLEGDIITPDLIGEYVHYLIRFENTGTYPAQNVVIKDLIDLSKFDISTLIPTKASHDFVTKISNNNKVEFIFENIQLPFADATNDGFVAFKIKTLPTLKVGDSFKNEANIYFDYNFPILTNTAKSTFQTLGTQEFQFSDYFSLYPNPVNDFVNIESKSTIEVKSMAVYDVLGQIIIAVPDAKTVSKIDVSILETGNYFLKMNTNKGTSNVKFIKK